ncbi:MAG: 4Fe-4S binding protein [Candidatus Lokiarchaeota archaeon]|nr:4Fe-4S binding protein [Candidatus Lokiarchaeota archaeon]
MSDTFKNIEVSSKENTKITRMQKLRIISHIILILLIVLHMITWYIMNIKIVGNIGIDAFFYGLAYGIINAGLIFWVIVLLSGLLLGRGFCGWFCMFGGYVELVGSRFKKSKIRIPRRAILYLGAIAFTGLIVQIFLSVIRIWFVSGLPSAYIIQLNIPEPWRGAQTILSTLITLILYGPVLIYIFGKRSWCRYLCPIGALLKVCSVVSPGKIRLVNNECVGCEVCNRNCDMQVDVMGELKNYGEIRSLDCIRCFKCTDICPQKSIKFTFRQTNASMSNKTTTRIERISSKRRKRSGFDLTIAVIWICFTVIFMFITLDKNTPVEIKVLMGSLLLIVIYGIISRIYKKITNQKVKKK